MKLRELISTLGRNDKYYARVSGDCIEVLMPSKDSNHPDWGNLIFTIPTAAESMSEGTTYAEEMEGLSLAHITFIGNTIQAYVSTAREEREIDTLYWVVLPSGHYMKPYATSNKNVNWCTVEALGGKYTEAQIKSIDPVYWQFAKKVKVKNNVN